MALMIPNIGNDFNGSYGEKQAYNSLKTLEDQFVVFHSFEWKTKTNNNFRRGEGDLIVFDPRFGLLVIEVKSGGIRSSNGVWYQQNFKTREEKMLKRSPLKQAENTMWTILSFFEKKNIEIPVYSAIWLTSISDNNSINDPAIAREIIFWKDDLQNPKRAFKRAFDYYNVKKLDYDSDLRRTIIETLSPEFNAMPTGRDMIDFNENNFVRMTSEQARILDFLVEQKEASILGGAGTGKTLLAVEKAKRLSETGKVLLLCYNQLLREDLTERVEKHSNIEVHNIFTFAQKYLSFSKKIFDIDEISELLLDYNKVMWPFNHVVIDEGQDMDPDHILLIKNINEIKEDGFFYVFYDENQTVQQREALTWRKELSCQLVLSVNCRNTRNIGETSNSVLEHRKKPKIKSDVEGERPTLSRVETKEKLIDELDNLIENYISKGYQREDIVILTHKTVEKSDLKDVIKIGRFSLETNERKPKRIFFTTSRKFKGLESPIVILIDLDVNSFNDEENRRLFYVATSRAKSVLNLFFTGNETDYNEFMQNYMNIETKFVKNRFSQKLNVDLLD